jgi:hypothetical protein
MRKIVREKPLLNPDPKLKQDFLDWEQRWLFLARSYEFNQRLTEFFRRDEAASG